MPESIVPPVPHSFYYFPYVSLFNPFPVVSPIHFSLSLWNNFRSGGACDPAHKFTRIRTKKCFPVKPLSIRPGDQAGSKTWRAKEVLVFGVPLSLTASAMEMGWAELKDSLRNHKQYVASPELNEKLYLQGKVCLPSLTIAESR